MLHYIIIALSIQITALIKRSLLVGIGPDPLQFHW